MSCIKWIVLLLPIGIVFANEDYFLRLDSIKVEEQCSRQGGLCTFGEDCPPGQLVGLGLCPKQRKSGVECCHGVSVKESRCRKRGGECMERCNKNLISREATDCKRGLKCCILV